MFEDSRIKVFMAVAEEHSFTLAAKSLGISQPAVSQNIAEIEKEIQILNAEGEAEALQIKGASVSSNPKIVQLEWIQKWDGKLPEIMTGDGNGLLLNIDK